jgi:hypothetical protein
MATCHGQAGIMVVVLTPHSKAWQVGSRTTIKHWGLAKAKVLMYSAMYGKMGEGVE